MGVDISTRLENHIDEYARRAQDELRGVMDDVAGEAKKAAYAALGTSGGADDSIHRGISKVPVTHLGGVWESGVQAKDWKSNFFEKGTHAHSIEPKARRVYSLTKSGRKRRRRVRSDHNTIVSGVHGYHYLRVGITTASASLRLLISSRFARIHV